MKESLVAGVDIGGSHITVALINKDSHEILDHSWRRFNIDSGAAASTIIAEWSATIKESLKAHNLKTSNLGIAMPGPFDYEKGICLIQQQHKYDALYGLNIKMLLAEALNLSIDKISMANDAACFLQGENINGAAKGKRNVLGLTIGTGLGSALTVDGYAEDADLWRAPFKNSIVEDYLSNRWFVKRYTELTGINVRNVKELAEQAASNRFAGEVFDEFGENLGAFITGITEKNDLEMAVLGGNIAKAYPLFQTALHQVLAKNEVKLDVKPTLLGENATLLGAASYCFKFKEMEQPISGGERLI